MIPYEEEGPCGEKRHRSIVPYSHDSEFPVGRPNLKTIRVACSCVLILSFCISGLGAQEKSPSSATPDVLPDESTLLFPDADDAPTDQPQSAVSFSFLDFLRMIIILGSVIGCIYAFFYLLRKFSGQRVQPPGAIRVVGSQVLSGNRSVHIVQVGNCTYLVGSSESSVGLIAEITDRETLDGIELARSASETTGRKSFSEVIQTMFAKGGDKGRRAMPEPGPSLSDSADFIKKQQERLKKFRGS